MMVPSLKPIWHGSRQEPVLHLTFDDGPDPRFTPQILALLSHYNIRATFFLLGHACEQYPLLTQHIANLGHDIGCHGYQHTNPWLCGRMRARNEVAKGWLSIHTVTGRAPCLFRPPYGHWRYSMAKQAQMMNMATVLWSRSARDWGAWGKKKNAVSKRLERSRNGDILLLHDGPMKKNRVDITVALLPEFIESRLHRGFRFSGLVKFIESDNKN